MGKVSGHTIQTLGAGAQEGCHSADGAPRPGLAQRPDAFPVTCLCAFLMAQVFLWLLLISIFRVKNVVDEGP